MDSQYVLVSSINCNSPNVNHEEGVIIDHPGGAHYFPGVFEDDGNPTVKSPGIMTGHVKITVVAVVLILLVLLYYPRQQE